MINRPPPLNALRAFEAAARHLSIRRAAEELCITHGAVSRHISKLEQHIGARLFVRHHRQIELTNDGARYNLQINDAFGRINAATAELVASVHRKSLRLKVPPTFAIRWLVPRLARFQARYPDMSVEVSTPFVIPPFASAPAVPALGPSPAQDFDVAVFYGRPDFPPNIVCECLFADVMMPVLRPDLAKSLPALNKPADLACHVLLHSLIRKGDWRDWLRAAGVTGVDPESGLRFENNGLVYQAVAEGLGVAVAKYTFVADDLASKQLVAPFDIYVKSDISYYLIYPDGRLKNPVVRDFRDWILEEARKSNLALPAGAAPRPSK